MITEETKIKEIFKKYTCNEMREMTEERFEQAAKEVWNAAIEEAAENGKVTGHEIYQDEYSYIAWSEEPEIDKDSILKLKIK